MTSKKDLRRALDELAESSDGEDADPGTLAEAVKKQISSGDSGPKTAKPRNVGRRGGGD